METKKITTTKRKKPKFFRITWHKMHKLGMKVKKKRKWRRAIGRHNKIRLNSRGRDVKPTIGWQSDKSIRGTIKGLLPVTVETVKQLDSVVKGQGIIIANVGKKKRLEIIKKANEMKITILNRYKTPAKEEKDAAS